MAAIEFPNQPSRDAIGIEELRRFLACDADGVLTWRESRCGRAMAGNVVGTNDGHGYLRFRLNGKMHMVHRVVWALHHGAWPTGDIDHKDGVKSNNRISNLRDASESVNMQNQKSPHRNNRSGTSVQGVHWCKSKRKFVALASRDGRRVHLGVFVTLAEAESVSIAYRRAHYQGFML